MCIRGPAREGRKVGFFQPVVFYSEAQADILTYPGGLSAACLEPYP